MISIFFSYANFVLMGYFKDISADRASGYNTFVVTFGWKKAAIASDFFALFSVLAAGWGILKVLSLETLFARQGAALLVYAASVFVLILAQAGIHGIRDENKAHRPIAHVVRGFLLLHIAEIIALKPNWIFPSLLFYACFEIVLKMRPEKRQV
jgi:4-hydroxybenzoate polyprenyltransferase